MPVTKRDWDGPMSVTKRDWDGPMSVTKRDWGGPSIDQLRPQRLASAMM